MNTVDSLFTHHKPLPIDALVATTKAALVWLLEQAAITDDIHLFNRKLRKWQDYYNYHRPRARSTAERRANAS